MDNMGKYGTARQATDDSVTTHKSAICVPDN